MKTDPGSAADSNDPRETRTCLCRPSIDNLNGLPIPHRVLAVRDNPFARLQPGGDLDLYSVVKTDLDLAPPSIAACDDHDRWFSFPAQESTGGQHDCIRIVGQ